MGALSDLFDTVKASPAGRLVGDVQAQGGVLPWLKSTGQAAYDKVSQIAHDPVGYAKGLGQDIIDNPDKFGEAMVGGFNPSHIGGAAMGLAGVLAPKRFLGKSLVDLPDNGWVKMGNKMDQFGTDQRLVDLAQRYASDNGLAYQPLTKYTPVDPMRAKGLAQAYEAMKHDPKDPAVAKSYQALMDETQKQFEALRRAGYNFDFIQGADPYGNPRNAINDLVQNKHMSVFPTEDGFGSSEPGGVDLRDNPLLQHSELQIGDGSIPTTYNDLFRAVHDAYGHAQYGLGFRAGGDVNAFQAHARMFSPEAIPAATSETRGQHSWVNYGPSGETNQTASPLDTKYAPQKTGIMPDWAWKSGVGE